MKRNTPQRLTMPEEKPLQKDPVIKMLGRTTIWIAFNGELLKPKWSTGKAVRWGIQREDAQPIAVASLWERFVDKDTGEVVLSFSVLTINADGHPVLKHFHEPNDEKRSIVVLENSN